MATPVIKIYELRTLGYDIVSKQLEGIAKSFVNIKRAKLSAEGKLNTATDIAEISKLADEINKLKLEEQKLRVERQKLVNEQKVLQLQRQAEITAQKKAIAQNKGEENSIVRIRVAMKELNAALILKNQQGTSTVSFRGEVLSIEQAVAKLKELTAAEQAFRRQFQADKTLVGEYTTGIVQAFKRMGLDDLVAGQITRVKSSLNTLNIDFDRLQQELKETRAAGNSTETIERQMIENRNEVIKLDTELVRLKTDLRGTGDIGNQITTSISKGFNNLKGQVAQFAVGFVGISALLSKLTQGISDAKISSDLTTDLQIQLDATEQETQELIEALKVLDTRTTLIGLEEIAKVALRAGVTSQNIFAVTEAIDKVKVSFGSDFGSVETGTETFAKLINIFFEDGEITGDRILKIGNAIRALANETVASVPFLTDFAGRMAGVKQISNVTLPDIIGLGAGFEEFKQSAEVSSTALVKVIPKMAKNIDEFARIAGVTNEEFKKLLTDTPIEALLKVSEGLVAGRGDVEQFANTLADAGLDAGRVTTIIATLGGKADIFRERIRRAGETIQSTTALTDAFALKNKNAASSLDRLNKTFSDFFASKIFQTVLAAIAVSLTVILNLLPVLIGLLGLYAIGWLTVSKEIIIAGIATKVTNAQLVLQRLALISNNLAIGTHLIFLKAVSITSKLWAAALFIVNGALVIVNKGLAFFNISLKATAGPLGILLALGGLLFTAFKAFGEQLSRGVDALKDLNIQQQIANDNAREAAKATSDQRAQATLLVGVIQNLSIVEGTLQGRQAIRLETLKKLIAIDPIFQDTLKDGVINYDKLREALDKYNFSLIQSAELEASRIRQTKEFGRLTELADIKRQLEIAITTGDFSKLEDNAKEFFKTIKRGRADVGLFPTSEKLKEVAREAITNLEKELTGQEKVVDAAGKAFTKKQIELDEAIKKAEVNRLTTIVIEFDRKIATFKGKDDELQKLKEQRAAAHEKLNVALGKEITPVIIKPFEIDIPALEDELKDLNKKISEFKGAQKELDALTVLRDKKEAELKKAKGDEPAGRTPRTFRGSRLSGEEKDAIKDIEAVRDEELANINLRFQKREIAEENFLLTIQRINTEAIDKKLQLLTGADATERKLEAELQLEKLKIQQETNDKIFDIKSRGLKEQLEIDIANANLQAKIIEEDPTVSETTRAQAKLDADNKILGFQIKFNEDIDQLEQDLSQKSVTNAKTGAAAIAKTRAEILEDQRKIVEAQLKDISIAGDKQRAQFNIDYEKLRQGIINNDKLTATQRKKALDRLAKLHNRTIISSELAQLTIEFEKIEELYRKGLTSEEEFIKAKEALEKSKTEHDIATKALVKVDIDLPSLANTQKKVAEQLSKAFGFEEGSEEDQLLGQVIAESFDLAQQAMNNYFDAEKNRIKQSLDVNLERLELEKEQVLAKAQSKEEEDSINKEFALKEKKARQQAGEQLKKVKRSEVRIALATELANIAVSAASAGPAAPILYAILAGLALARYALNVAAINREQFKFGGKPGEVPIRGGKFKGQAHSRGGTPFHFKGRGYEAEAKELAIVRTKDAPKGKTYTIKGTQEQIASAINTIGGGINFKPGAKLLKFQRGGFLGQTLEAPIFTPASNTVINNGGGITEEKFDELLEKITEMNTETSKRIDRIQTFVTDKDITEAQNKRTRQTQIGTL